jgi:ketosteroid isomerase-like protein
VNIDILKLLPMKFHTWHSAALLFLILFQTGCDKESKYKRMSNELLEIDRAFARLSIEKGANQAFQYYIDDSCVLLRPNRNPILGKQKITEMFSASDTSFTLNWDPLNSNISSSGDLGYTYGIYKVEMDSPQGRQVTKEGTYVTIWKKDHDGNWKFVFDTGNQGLGKKNGEME